MSEQASPAGSQSGFHGHAAAASTDRALWSGAKLPNGVALHHLATLASRVLGADTGEVLLQARLRGMLAAGVTTGDGLLADEEWSRLVLETGRAVAVADTRADARTAAFASVRSGVVVGFLGVPILIHGEPVGALAVSTIASRTWTSEEVALLEQLAAPVVTELQLALVAADYATERLAWELAVEAAGVGAFDWNLETGDLRWDDRLLELFGLTRETFGGTIEAFNDAVHPDDRERVSAALAAAVETCGPYEAEYRVLRPDGAVCWVAARGQALAGAGGAAVRLLGAAFDTTAVQDGEARVSRVLEAMPTAFFHLDPEWRFTYLNGEARRLLGDAGHAELVGGVVWDLFPDAPGSDFEHHYRQAVASGEPVAFEAYYPSPLAGWYEVRAWPTPDGLSVYFIDITTRRLAQEAAATALRRTERLVSVTEALTSTLDVEEAIHQLACIMVGDVADWSVVTLVDHPSHQDEGGASVGTSPSPRRHLRDVGGWHVEPALRPLVERYAELRIAALTDEAFLFQALTERRPVVVDGNVARALSEVLQPGEARDLCLRLDPASAVAVPLRGRDRIVGLLTVFRGAGRPPFSAEDVAELADAGGRAGLALDNARLYAEQRDLAGGLQRSLMTAPPEPDALQVLVRYEPAAEAAQVGGDWYDAFLQPDGATSLVIGDVVGHDTVAAAAMGQVRGLLRGIAATTDETPAAVLRRVDAAMELLRIDTTVTALMARIEQTPEDRARGVRRLRWSNAGHPPPLVAVPRRPGDPTAGVEVTALWPDHSEPLLGLDPSFARSDAVMELPAGSTVLLYTDGLIERRGEVLDEGIERLEAALADLVAAETAPEALCTELLRRMVVPHHEDDIAMVVVRLHPQDPVAPGEQVAP